MRSGMWMLAVCGTVGLVWTAGTAEERLFEPNFSDRDQPSRYRRSSNSHSTHAEPPVRSDPSASRVENYHRDLFGVEPPAKPPVRSQASRESVSFRSRVRLIEQIGRHEPSRTVRTVPDVAFRRIALDSELKESSHRQPPPFADPDSPRPVETGSKPPEIFRSERPEFAESPRPGDGPKPFNLSNILQAKHSQNGHTARDDGVGQVGTTDGNISPFRTAEAPTRLDTAPSGRPLPVGTEPIPIGLELDPSCSTMVTSGLSDAGASDIPAVSVEWLKRSDISVGQECRFDLIVKNRGRAVARDIAIDAYFPTTVRLTSAEPKPVESPDHLSWKFASLAPGKAETIKIGMIPSRPGELATKAVVRFTGSACGLFAVEEPLLKVTVQGPQEVMLGEPASQIVTVSNPGSGVARDVQVETVIPAGLEHPRGGRLVTEIGSLNPGESRKVRLALAAIEGGEHRLLVKVRAGNAVGQSAEARIVVSAPSIKLAIDGPGLRYKSRTARYRLTVANDGSGATNNVRVMYEAPEGFDFLRADKGGRFDSVNKTVSWFVGRLDIGESVEVELELKATALGDFVHRASAFSEHATRTDARIETRVQGTASLVLEIVDLDDPVEIGRETAYEVRVHNEGSKGAHNVGLSCELPAGVELIGAKGPADHLVENGSVVFGSLAELAPGKTAVYRVHVRGLAEGNHRFRARLASDSIKQPLVFEELTKFYQD